jgi:hypothetical protein
MRWDGMAHPHVAFVMEGGGASWWRAGDRSSNLLLGQALTAHPARGCVLHLDGKSQREIDLSNTATADI